MTGFEFRWESGGEAVASTGPGRVSREVSMVETAEVSTSPARTTPRRVETTVLEHPGVGDEPGPAGMGSPARIDFETFGTVARDALRAR